MPGISPGGRPIDTSPLSQSKTSNWVARNGGLPPYVRGIARGVAKRHGGKVTGRDIAVAWTYVNKLAATSKNPAVKAAATKAVAQENALQARARAKRALNLSATGENDIELDWSSWNQAHKKGPRQKKAQPAPAQNTGAIAGYSGPALNPDVADKVRQFQQENGLAVTGNLDAATVNYAQQYPEKVAAAKAAKTAAAAAKKVATAKASADKKAQAAKTKAAKAKVSAAKKAATARAKSAKAAQTASKNKAKAAVTAQKKKISTQISNLNVEMAKARVAGDKAAQGKIAVKVAELRAASSNL